MKTLLQIAFLSFISIVAFSQKSSYPGVAYSELYQVAADGDHITTVGSCDLAMHSSDGGSTWSEFPVGIQFSDMALVPNTDAKQVFLSFSFNLYILDVETEEVTEVTPSGLVIGRIRDIAVSGDQLFMTGDIGLAVADVDDLTSATPIGEFEYQGNDFIRGSSVTDNYVYSYSNQGLLFRSPKDGSGTETLEGNGDRFRSLAMGTDVIGYASFSSLNKPWKTTDGGETWTEMAEFSEAATMMAYGENVVMSRNTNRILLSEDGGATVEYIPYMNRSEIGLMQNHFFDGSTLYLCGKGSMVLRSDDFGRTHQNLIDINRSDLVDIDFNDAGVGAAVGGTDLLVVTTDKGETWNTISVDVAEDQYFSSCLVLADGTILAAHDIGLLSVTVDGYSVISDETLQAITYVPADNSLIGVKTQGSTRVIRKSTDDGMTWDTKGVLETFQNHIHVSPTGKLAIGGSDGMVTMSDDNGDSWKTIQFPVSNSITDINIYSDELMLFGSGNEMHKSTDGGVTSSTLFNSYIPRNILIIDEDNYVVTQGQNSQAQVRRTEDGGSTWKTVASYCEASNDGLLHDGYFWTAHRAGHINTFELDPITSTNDIKVDRQWIVNTMLQSGDHIMINEGVGEGSLVRIIDQSGRHIKRVALNSTGANRIETMSMNAGLYFVQFSNGVVIHTEKIVITR